MEPRQQLRRLLGLVQRYAHFSAFLVLVLATYVAWSLLDYQDWAGLALVALTCVTGIQGMAAAAGGRPPGLWAFVLTLAACAFAIVGIIDEPRPWLGIGSLLAVALVTVGAFTVLRHIVLTTHVGGDPILGAISVYALLGIIFAHVYGAIHRLGADPFFQGHPGAEGSDFVFFSYTTLTTTGYGDLVPAGQPGEMLAGLEMLVGQIFLVTLIARLVALWKPGEILRRREHSEGEA